MKKINPNNYRAIWEYHNGEIPQGYHIHHINHDHNDNRIENLMMLSNSDHKKIHGNWEMIDGILVNPNPKTKQICVHLDLEHYEIIEKELVKKITESKNTQSISAFLTAKLLNHFNIKRGK